MARVRAYFRRVAHSPKACECPWLTINAESALPPGTNPDDLMDSYPGFRRPNPQAARGAAKMPPMGGSHAADATLPAATVAAAGRSGWPRAKSNTTDFRCFVPTEM